MAAGYQNLFIEKGSTFSITINLDDAYGSAYNLSSSFVSSQIRKSYYSANATAQFEALINGISGSITLSLTSAVTANIAPGRYVYDTFVSFPPTEYGQPNTVIKILEGTVDVVPSATRF